MPWFAPPTLMKVATWNIVFIIDGCGIAYRAHLEIFQVKMVTERDGRGGGANRCVGSSALEIVGERRLEDVYFMKTKMVTSITTVCSR